MAKKTLFVPVKAVATRMGFLKTQHEQQERPARPKLLVGVVNRGSGRKVKRILNDLSVALSITFTGYGTARSALLDYLGIGETEKTILFSLIPETDEARIIRELRKQMSLYLAGKGILFTVPLAGVSEKIADGILEAAESKTMEEKIMKKEDRRFDLVIVSVRAGNADEAMEAARGAGASGGTVVRARATENQKAEQFVGVSLLPEQEMLMILTKKERTQAIMDALSEKVGLKTPACGVIFALPVDKTAGISADEEGETPAGKEA